MDVLRDQNGLTESEFLESYNAGDYERPSVAADIVIFTVAALPEKSYRRLTGKELRVLLIRRGGHPFLGKWALPGGFVRSHESVGAAAARELREETGVESGYLEQLYTFSEPGRDPRTWVMSCAHMALVDSSALTLQAGDDAADAAWFRAELQLLPASDADTDHPADAAEVPAAPPARRYRLTLAGPETLTAVVEEAADPSGPDYRILANDGLAFDHAKIITCALRRLRGKLAYTDLALNLMPERFTLTELQQVYEVILGRPLLKAAFRRKVAPLVQETGEYTGNKGHRPSQLFCRQPVQEAAGREDDA